MLAILPLTAQTVAVESLYAAAVRADHPVAYYQLGEAPGATVAADSSGNGNNGTYELNPVLGVSGLINNPAATAVDFVGAGNVTIPNAADLNFVNAPFTIEAWVNGTLSTEQCCQGNARISSGITSKPAIEGHFKTGQRTITLDELVLPYRTAVWQLQFDPIRSLPSDHQPGILQDLIPVFPFLCRELSFEN
jgi:hypothetical protein